MRVSFEGLFPRRHGLASIVYPYLSLRLWKSVLT
jgi:hypothetical protein